MLQGENSAILSTFIKLQIVIKIFVWSIFEWPFYTRFTVNITDLYYIFGVSGYKCQLYVLINTIGPFILMYHQTHQITVE